MCCSPGVWTRDVLLLPPLLLPVLLRLCPEQGHGHHPGVLDHVSTSCMSTPPGAASHSWCSSPHPRPAIPPSRPWGRSWRRWTIGGEERRTTRIHALLLLGRPCTSSPSTQERVYSSLQGGLCLSKVTPPLKTRTQKQKAQSQGADPTQKPPPGQAHCKGPEAAQDDRRHLHQVQHQL